LQRQLTDDQLLTLISPQRLQTIHQVLGNRQLDLTLVIENVHDPHNVGAIFRSADAVGIEAVQLLYTQEHFPKLHPKVTASGGKWVKQKHWDDVDRMVHDLKQRDFKLYTTRLSEDAVSIHDIDWTQPAAIIVGNENRGVSDQLAEQADQNILIPMFGMVESLNVSVATAVMLFEACRQRIAAGQYPNTKLSPAWLDDRSREWIQINQPRLNHISET